MNELLRIADGIYRDKSWPAFVDVCCNEKFDDYREMEVPLGVCARALINNKAQFDFLEIQTWEIKSQQRAGYIIQLLCGWAENNVYDKYWNYTENIYQNMHKSFISIPFFHIDPPGEGHDELAIYWSLTRGLLVNRLRRLTEFPYVV